MSAPETAWTTSETIRLKTRPAQGRSMRQRFVVAISGLVALVLVSQAAFLILLGYRHLHHQVEAEARSFAVLAAAPICQAYRRYHDSGTSKFLELVAQTASLNEDLLAIRLFDTEGRELFTFERSSDNDNDNDSGNSDSTGTGGGDNDSTDPASHASGATTAWSGPPTDERLVAAVYGLDQADWLTRNDSHDEQLIVVQPNIEDWGRHQLSVVFLFGFRSVDQAFAGFGTWLAVLGLGGLALGVGCAYVLAGQSLGPVERLTYGARQLAKGHLDHRIQLRSGDELGVLGATLDHMASLLSGTIADLETSNESLEKANAELREVDRVKSDLLANVSHELRTPLTAISGYVEAMEAGLLGDINEVQKDSLQVVARNIFRLRTMIDQLLSYSRMDSGRMRVDLQPFDLEAVARYVAEAVSAAQRGRVKVLIETEADLPEGYGDSARIAQVIENLLTNAAKFSPDGAAVKIHLGPVPGGLQVTIEDHGIGIAKEHQARIFDRFYQVDASSRRQYGGMGLGLAIVKEILDLHHGTLEVESSPGVGSTFRFVIPLAEDRTSLVPIDGAKRLLVIDDDALFVQRLSSHLSQRGWQVQTAASAEQGSMLARRLRPDAILLDRLLPDQDGFDLLRRLRQDERTRELPIVLCTVRPERGLGLRLGADDYWVKPLDPEQVEHALETLLATPRGEQAGPEEKPEKMTRESSSKAHES